MAPTHILLLKANVRPHTRRLGGRLVYVRGYRTSVPPAEVKAPTLADPGQMDLFAQPPRPVPPAPPAPATLEPLVQESIVPGTERLVGNQGRSENVDTDPRIAAYEAAGGKLWTGQNGQQRIYFNNIDIPAVLGWQINRYGTGNVSGAMLNGQKVSNAKATAAMQRLGYAKIWIDVADWKFRTDRLTPDELEAVSAEIKRRAGR